MDFSRERFDMNISAQVSLYPLKQQRLSPAVEEAWRILEENRLDLKKGGMSTVVNGLAERVFAGIQEVFMGAAERGALSMVVTYSNACPAQREIDQNENPGRTD
jgi:uncharacterized protein YqgV (UPF0045/DUF77 family)